jgi:hypothetical protein
MLVASCRGADRGHDNCTAATVIAGFASIPAQKEAGCRERRERGLPQRINPFPVCKSKNATEKMPEKKCIGSLSRRAS